MDIIQKMSEDFDEKFVPSSLKWKDAVHCTCCSTKEEYDAIKHFIFHTYTKELSEAVKSMKRPDNWMGDAPSDNAVGSEQRAFGWNSAIDAVVTRLQARESKK